MSGTTGDPRSDLHRENSGTVGAPVPAAPQPTSSPCSEAMAECFGSPLPPLVLGAAPQPETGEERPLVGAVRELFDAFGITGNLCGVNEQFGEASAVEIIKFAAKIKRRSRPVVEACEEPHRYPHSCDAWREEGFGCAICNPCLFAHPVVQAPALSEEHTAIPATAMLEIARYVGIPGEAMARLLGVLRIVMAGRALSASPSAERVEQLAATLDAIHTAAITEQPATAFSEFVVAKSAKARHIASEIGTSAPHAAPPSDREGTRA